MKGFVAAAAALLIHAMIANGAGAQGPPARTVLTTSGWPISATSTTGADFENGAVSIGTTTVTVDATVNNTGFSNRTTTVEVLCLAPCPSSGTLPLSGLQWRRDDQVTWTTLTTAFVVIETRSLVFGGLNDPWSRGILWRYALNWTANPPTAPTAFPVQFRLTVTAP